MTEVITAAADMRPRVKQGLPVSLRSIHIALATLGAILSLTLTGCAAPSTGTAAVSTATPSSTPTVEVPTYTPAAANECGFVHFGPPGLSPANYAQLVACFVTSFQQCHTVHFVYEFFSDTDQGHNDLSVSGTAQQCRVHVQEHYVSTKTNPASTADYSYTCSRVDRQTDHYVVTGCDNGFEINFPPTSS